MAKYDTRAKKDLQEEYTEVAKAEHWNAFARKKQDLFGVFDFVAVNDDEIAGVQITSWGNISARRKKIQSSDVYKPWISAGGVILLIGYKKVKGRYRRKTERHTKNGIQVTKWRKKKN